MRYVFFGSPEFASQVLRGLLDAGMPPTALVCNPDRPTGRKRIITLPTTKKLIQEEGLDLEILQPEDKQELLALSLTLTKRADFGIVAAYAMIIPDELIKAFKFGIIGVHPSLLPKYRGASPIRSAMLAGEEKTGASLFVLDDKVDHGAVLARKDLNIGNKYYEELAKELAVLSGNLLVEILPDFAEGKIEGQEQEHKEAVKTGKFKTGDAYVEWSDVEKAIGGNEGMAKSILRKIRAFNPEPGAFTIMDGKRTKLLRARLESNKLVLERIQREGKTPVDL